MTKTEATETLPASPLRVAVHIRPASEHSAPGHSGQKQGVPGQGADDLPPAQAQRSGSAQRQFEILTSRALGQKLMGADRPNQSVSYSHSLRRRGSGKQRQAVQLAVAVSCAGGGRRHGVDLEWLDRRPLPIAALAKRAFPSPTDEQFMGRSWPATGTGNPAATEYFMRLWTAREAAVKALGLTLAAARKRLIILPLANGWQLQLDGQELTDCQIAHYRPTSALLLALAWRKTGDDAAAPGLLLADDQLQFSQQQAQAYTGASV